MRHLSWYRVGWGGECGWRGMVLVMLCVCVCVCVCVPILQFCKECFCLSKGSLGSFASSSSSTSVFFPTSILPHTFEPLCGIVPWSWLGSLLPRPPSASWPAGSRPPDRMLPAGARLRGKVSRKLRSQGSMREPELLLSQFRTGRAGG